MVIFSYFGRRCSWVDGKLAYYMNHLEKGKWITLSMRLHDARYKRVVFSSVDEKFGSDLYKAVVSSWEWTF